METELRHRLGISEKIMNNSNSQVRSFKKLVEKSIREEIEYENWFTGKVYNVKTLLKSINSERSAQIMASMASLNDFVNFETQNSAQLKENIKNMIDSFDDAVTNRAKEVDTSPGVTMSLLETEIKNLDKLVSNLDK